MVSILSNLELCHSFSNSKPFQLGAEEVEVGCPSWRHDSHDVVIKLGNLSAIVVLTIEESDAVAAQTEFGALSACEQMMAFWETVSVHQVRAAHMGLESGGA